MKRILSYAIAQGYSKYTSTLEEPWRVSIAGMTNAIIEGYEIYGDSLPEFFPDDTFDDPITSFGIKEAQLHRKRGTNLAMFLGLYKYYRYTFEDFVQHLDLSCSKKEYYRSFIERLFDRIEIAFCTEWSNLGEDKIITELQEANRLIINEKNKYLTLFESLNLPTFLIDEKGFLENLNVPAAKLLGDETIAGQMYYSLEKHDVLRQKPLSAWIPWLKDSIDRLLKENASSFHLEIEEPEESGGRFFYAALSRMGDISKKFTGGILILEDLTERKSMEKLKDDIDRITKHDLKIPLSGMLAAINYLLDSETLAPEHRNIIKMASDSGYTMLSMINLSLDMYKMEVGTYQFDPKPVDLGSMLRRLSHNMASYSTNQNAPFSVEIEGTEFDESQPGPYLLADDLLLYTALGNLLKNALEASPLGQPVRVAVDSDTLCRISIFNTGGVPTEIRDSFFEKYSTWGKQSGTGLGSYSSRLFIKTMGGSVSMSSSGGTTKVTVTIPLFKE